MEGLQPIDIRSDNIRKQPPVDKKCLDECLDVVEIQDKFVNTLLTLAEHLNRLRYCRNRFVGSRKFKDVYGDHPCEVARD
jgi:hypothetical protein